MRDLRVRAPRAAAWHGATDQQIPRGRVQRIGGGAASAALPRQLLPAAHDSRRGKQARAAAASPFRTVGAPFRRARAVPIPILGGACGRCCMLRFGAWRAPRRVAQVHRERVAHVASRMLGSVPERGPHLRRDWPHISAGTGPTSVPGLCPHLRRDWPHICAGTGPHSAPELAGGGQCTNELCSGDWWGKPPSRGETVCRACAPRG